MIDLNFFETEIFILIYGTTTILAFALGFLYGYYYKKKNGKSNKT